MTQQELEKYKNYSCGYYHYKPIMVQAIQYKNDEQLFAWLDGMFRGQAAFEIVPEKQNNYYKRLVVQAEDFSCSNRIWPNYMVVFHGFFVECMRQSEFKKRFLGHRAFFKSRLNGELQLEGEDKMVFVSELWENNTDIGRGKKVNKTQREGAVYA